MAISKAVGRTVTVQNLMDFTLSKWFSLVITGLLFNIILSVTSFLIIPLIYFAVAFVFHLNVAAVSGQRGFKALAASARLVKGSFMKRLMYALAFVLMSVAAGLASNLILFGLYPDPGLELTFLSGAVTVALNVLSETVSSVFIMAQCVWFVNILMCRKAVQTETNI